MSALPVDLRKRLEKRLASLPLAVFTADDSLRWTCQFWQADKKDRVNESGVRIGADERPAVTQLFTEHCMVPFLFRRGFRKSSPFDTRAFSLTRVGIIQTVYGQLALGPSGRIFRTVSGKLAVGASDRILQTASEELTDSTPSIEGVAAATRRSR